MAESDNGLYVVPDTPEVEPFRRQGLGYVFEPPDVGVRFLVDRVTRGSEGPQARITVASTLPALPGLMYRGRHRLEGSRSLADLRKALEEIAGPEYGIPWGALIRTLSASVVDAEEQGTPIKRLSAIPARAARPDLVQHLVQDGRTNVLYGPGSYGKGWIAVATAVAVASGQSFAGLRVGGQGPVLYLDWEDDEDIFRARVRAICAGIDPDLDPDSLPLLYRECERPFVDDVEYLSGQVDREGVRYMVLDSVEAATQGNPHQTLNDRATDMNRGLRVFHCARLLIDHVSDEGRRGGGLAGKPINGIMKTNGVRNQWEIKREQEVETTVSHVGVYQTKTNHTAQLAPLGLCLDFRQEGVVRITREDVRESDVLAAPLSTRYRIEGELRKGPRTRPQLYAALSDLKEDTINKNVQRGLGKWCVEVSAAVSAKGEHAVLALLAPERVGA